MADTYTMNPLEHNQGGSTNQKYHLTAAQHAAATRFMSELQSGLFSSSDAPKLEYVSVPLSSSDPGLIYQRAVDSSYAYFYTSDTWKKALWGTVYPPSSSSTSSTSSLEYSSSSSKSTASALSESTQSHSSVSALSYSSQSHSTQSQSSASKSSVSSLSSFTSISTSSSSTSASSRSSFTSWSSDTTWSESTASESSYGTSGSSTSSDTSETSGGSTSSASFSSISTRSESSPSESSKTISSDSSSSTSTNTVSSFSSTSESTWSETSASETSFFFSGSTLSSPSSQSPSSPSSPSTQSPSTDSDDVPLVCPCWQPPCGSFLASYALTNGLLSDYDSEPIFKYIEHEASLPDGNPLEARILGFIFMPAVPASACLWAVPVLSLVVQMRFYSGGVPGAWQSPLYAGPAKVELFGGLRWQVELLDTIGPTYVADKLDGATPVGIYYKETYYPVDPILGGYGTVKLGFTVT